MDFPTFFRIVLRNWWLIILATITTAGSAAYVVSRQEPEYRAVTRVLLSPSVQLADPREVVDVINALEKRTQINTLARLATGNAMQEKIAKALNVPQLVVTESDLTAVVVPETNLIEIRATSTNPKLAAAITNAVAQELSKQISEKAIQINVIDTALPPTEPVGPQPVRTITLGVIFGLALGIVFALLGYMIQTLRGSKETPAPAPQASDQPSFASALDTHAQGGQTRQFYTR